LIFVFRNLYQYLIIRQEKKLRIVNCCGFDCIPADLGVHMLVQSLKKHSLESLEVTLIADEAKGSVSTGTLSSIMNIFEKTSFPDLIDSLNPFYLNPRQFITTTGLPTSKVGVVTPPLTWSEYWRCLDRLFITYNSQLNVWTAPYIMQSIDTRIVHRSNCLQNWSYGEHFVFNEGYKTPNVYIAIAVMFGMMFVGSLVLFPPTRWILKSCLPWLQRGPSQHLLDHGYFTIKFVGSGINKQNNERQYILGNVSAKNGDPGYR
jgi:short subunit dehydrogenase-like uncharacterized protein